MAKKLYSVRLDEELVREAGGSRTASQTIQRALELMRDDERERRFWRRWAGKGASDSFAVISRVPRRT
jgi:hypothetical protein